MAITNYVFRRPTYPAWRDFEHASNRLARFFEDSTVRVGGRAGHWIPPVTVSETADELVLTSELPGLGEDDVSIELENNVLSISGEKVEVRTEGAEEHRYHVRERSFGSFARSFTLPRTVDGSNIVATFDHGVLTVKLPKVAEAKGRKIEITK